MRILSLVTIQMHQALRRLPRFTHTRQVQALMASVAHHIPQIQQKCFFQVVHALFRQSIPEGKQSVTGKTQCGIVEADRFEILPCSAFFFRREELRKPRH